VHETKAKPSEKVERLGIQGIPSGIQIKNV
jgi:hypothetical protein